MVDLVVDPGFVVVDGVVLDRVPGQIFIETVDDFNLFEVDDDTALCAAGNVAHCVSLHRNLHCVVRGYHGELGVPAWIDSSLKEGTSTEVDTHVAFGDLMDTIENYCADEEHHPYDHF